MPTARFEADFSGFIAAINGAQMSLVNFNKGAETVEQTLNDMTDKFSGRALIQEASLMTIAIEKLGGTSMLTAQELEEVGTKANEAVAKLRAMGSDVPAGLQQLADATAENVGATSDWSAALGGLQSALGAVGVTASMTAVINWLKGVGAASEEIENLGKRMQATTYEVQQFQAVAAATGVPLNTMVKGFQDIEAKLGTAAGAGIAAELTKLGISIADFKKETPWEAYETLATAIGKIEDPYQKAEAARAIFGNGFRQMLPALDEAAVKSADSTTKMTGATVDFFARSWEQLKTYSADLYAWSANTTAAMADPYRALREYLVLVQSLPDIGNVLPKAEQYKPMIQGASDAAAAEKDLNDQLKAQQKGLTDWQGAVKAVDQATGDWHATLDGLDGAVVEQAESLLKLGVKAQDVQKYFGLADDAMVALQKDMKEWGPVGAAFDAARAAAENWHTTLDGLNPTMVEASKYYLSLGLSVQQTALIMQDSVKDVQAVKNGMAEASAATDRLKTAQAEYNDYLAKTTEDATTYQINKLWEKVGAEEDSFKGSEAQRAEYNKVVEALADAQTNAIVAAAYKGEEGTAAALDQTVDDYKQAAAKIQTFNFKPGTQDEQQAMSAALAEVNATNIGRMIQQGTQSVDLMNQYEAAIEAAMAARGYSVGGGLTPAAQAAGYSGGSTTNTTVNVNSPLGTPAAISAAVSAALADAMRRYGVRLPSQ